MQFLQDIKLIWRFVKTVGTQFVQGIKFICRLVLNCLDIRQRHWLVAAVLFYGLLFFIIMSIRTTLILREELFVKNLQVSAIKRADKEQQAMSKTMQVAYGMSEPAGDFYAYIYKRVSYKYGISWEAFAATTKIESGFDPAAKSPAGACGLMQLLESTAEDHCRRLGIPYRKNFTVWNPVTNLYLGASYFNFCYTNGILDQKPRLSEAFKRYLGGSKYRRATQQQESIASYANMVLQEYEKLNYIYVGVLSTYK